MIFGYIFIILKVKFQNSTGVQKLKINIFENLEGVYTSRVTSQCKLKLASYTTKSVVYKEYMRLA